MLELTDYIIIFLLGSLGGFISGFLGVGGGIIYIPILDYFLGKLGFTDGMLVKAILANSLFTIIFSGSISSYKQYKAGNFFLREILLTAWPGILTALIFTWLIQHGTWYSKEVFNFVFAGMLLVITSRMFLADTKSNEEKESKPIQFNLTGAFAGIVTAMSGLGGGVVMMPVFTDILKQGIKKASSISNGVIPLFAIFIGICNLAGAPVMHAGQWQIGYILLPVVAPLILAAFVFAPLGVMASHSAPQKLIRFTFGFFVSVVFIKTVLTIAGF